ncbi:MAG TPA: LpqB family beta-propeller domain-containing protein [Woeseiaceae bacterium]|nr:LpqB family beta-propeller domain-containing protein [Woeseiaceae bacterium]
MSPAAAAQMILSEGTNLSADLSPVDGRIAIDLVGSIWLVPPGGGAAEKVSNGLQPAMRPKWSPDGKRILYQTISPLGSRIWMLDVETSASTAMTDGANFDQHPEWHPSGERIAFSSVRGDTGFDLWEMHLETGLSWRLSQHPGDETEPAWSADGRDLAYISRQDDQWRLVLRRHGQSDQDLVISDQPLAAPSWRPDGSLLTFLRFRDEKYQLEMVILSDPPLSRPLASNEDFFLAPVSWRDRLHFLYTADGIIKARGLNDWRAGKVPFTAEVRPPALPLPPPADDNPPEELEIVSPPAGRLVIRAARLFDGVASGYRNDVDVLLDGGRIAAVEYRHDWDDATILDLGDATILPGFIDSYASLPDRGAEEIGLALLAYGVTTIVASGLADGAENPDPALWETEQSPGPRLLRAAPLGQADADNPVPLALLTIPAAGLAGGGDALQTLRQRGMPVLAESLRVGVAVGADLLLGAATMPASPLGRRYQDVRIAALAGPATLVSGLADAATPGVSELLQSRQALAFEHWTAGQAAPSRRFPELPGLAGSSSFVVGSKPNGLPAGLALHAELRALSAAGLSGDEVLRAAGANAADALGFPGQLGRIMPGALADLVLVAGDPEARIADALNIVAVVRNGRFYSLVRLLEEARRAALVE